MNQIPKNFYRYKQNPLWNNQTLPSWFSNMHNTKSWVYWNIVVYKWALKYTSFESENWNIDGELIINTWEERVSLPQKWHKVEPVWDVEFVLEFYKEMDEKIYELKKDFDEKIPWFKTHYEVEYIASLIEDRKNKKALDLWAWSWRNSLFLANSWFEVHSWDKNTKWLEFIDTKAKENNLNIITKETNLNLNFVKENYDLIITTVALQFLEKIPAKMLIKSMTEKTNIWWYNLIIAPIDAPDHKCPIRFPNLPTYEEYLNFYKYWEIIYTDNYFGKFHVVDENWNKVVSRFATIIAKKTK